MAMTSSIRGARLSGSVAALSTDGYSYSAGLKSHRLHAPAPPNHFWVHLVLRSPPRGERTQKLIANRVRRAASKIFPERWRWPTGDFPRLRHPATIFVFSTLIQRNLHRRAT
jgi:hypothetical protein